MDKEEDMRIPPPKSSICSSDPSCTYSYKLAMFKALQDDKQGLAVKTTGCVIQSSSGSSLLSTSL